MRELKFIVSRQRIRKDNNCDFSNLIAGSIGYLKAVFDFSPEWSDCKKAASFWLDEKEYSVLLDDNDSCVIPSEALTGSKFEVSVTGVKAGYKIRTCATKVRQEV